MKLSAGTLITIVAAALLCVFAYRSMTREVTQQPVTAANCTTEAIRNVADPVERAILSDRCAKQQRRSD